MKFFGGMNIGMAICVFIGFHNYLNTTGYDFVAWALAIAGSIILGAGFVFLGEHDE